MFGKYFVLLSVLVLLGSAVTSAYALVAYEPPQTSCPVYSPCGPGMEGYNAGKDENGCDKMACRPAKPDNDPDTDQPPPEDHQPDDLLKEDRKTYKYEQNDNTPPVPPRAIDVQ